VIDAPIAFAFTAGMVATVNPCGFAMLPAYLGYFLGLEGRDEGDATASLVRALVVGAVVSAGFLVLFGVAGALFSWTSFGVYQVSPWLTVAIGAVLTIAGLAFVRGWSPSIALPRLDRGGRTRGLGSMFVFGLSYAVASLSCTLPGFLGVVSTTFSRESVASGVVTFVAYGLGMGLLLTAITVALALARQGLVGTLRRALPYVQRVSGAIMAVTGAYLIWYGIYEIRLIQRGESTGRGPVGIVTGWSAHLSDRLAGLDPLTTALALALVLTLVVLVALLRSGQRVGPSRR
jgi:cytochrome c biogenesis protein CcdA